MVCVCVQMQQHFEFTCKLNFEDLNYNYNYIENEYYMPARIIPRYSSLPRTMSMLANTSKSSSSSDNEEDCHSLADSLEDLSRYASLFYESQFIIRLEENEETNF